jgi:hypothetical protein
MLIKNLLNEFIVGITLNGEEYPDQKVFIEYKIDCKKNYHYKITLETNNEDLNSIVNYFGDEYIEGVKGFGKHIISDNRFYLVYYDKKKILELITFDNSLFMNGNLI